MGFITLTNTDVIWYFDFNITPYSMSTTGLNIRMWKNLEFRSTISKKTFQMMNILGTKGGTGLIDVRQGRTVTQTLIKLDANFRNSRRHPI